MKNPFNHMSLRRAAKRGDAPAVRRLVEKGADLNSKDDRGNNALMLAAQKGQIEAVRCLIDQGADIDANNLNQTPLVMALGCNHVDVARLLVERGANVNGHQREGYANETPLTVAARYQSPDTMRFLIERGADIEAAGVLGTPLLVAAKYGNVAVVEYLLSRGANPHAAVSFLDDYSIQWKSTEPDKAADIEKLLKDELEVERAERLKRHNGFGARPGRTEPPRGFSL